MKSSIETFDTRTDSVTVVFQSDRLVEAPNWSPDGRFLILNSDGRLFRLNLGNPDRLHPIDTGFATACNNDHGISPDGTRLAISDRSEGTVGIYTLPIEGGEPRAVTPNRPSYWHGWSPDGMTLAYCARREDRFVICTIPVDGGEETRVTDASGHDDAPDYTSDGDWIWFNSDRSGRMQLWRIRSDGRDLEQMTDDERANWFPHPSPDGCTVLYLAYAPGVTGHPRDLPVELRLMPPGGGDGAPRVAVDLLGGQGSINVPCWAPDGRRFAFVRYQSG